MTVTRKQWTLPTIPWGRLANRQNQSTEEVAGKALVAVAVLYGALCGIRWVSRKFCAQSGSTNQQDGKVSKATSALLPVVPVTQEEGTSALLPTVPLKIADAMNFLRDLSKPGDLCLGTRFQKELLPVLVISWMDSTGMELKAVETAVRKWDAIIEDAVAPVAQGGESAVHPLVLWWDKFKTHLSEPLLDPDIFLIFAYLHINTEEMGRIGAKWMALYKEILQQKLASQSCVAFRSRIQDLVSESATVDSVVGLNDLLVAYTMRVVNDSTSLSQESCKNMCLFLDELVQMDCKEDISVIAKIEEVLLTSLRKDIETCEREIPETCRQLWNDMRSAWFSYHMTVEGQQEEARNLCLSYLDSLIQQVSLSGLTDLTCMLYRMRCMQFDRHFQASELVSLRSLYEKGDQTAHECLKAYFTVVKDFSRHLGVLRCNDLDAKKISLKTFQEVCDEAMKLCCPSSQERSEAEILFSGMVKGICNRDFDLGEAGRFGIMIEVLSFMLRDMADKRVNPQERSPAVLPGAVERLGGMIGLAVSDSDNDLANKLVAEVIGSAQKEREENSSLD